MPLYFIRHARPIITEGTPAHLWPLSDEGRAACLPLVERLRYAGIQRIYSSHEAKATETGSIVAQALGIPIETAADLHEHVRTKVPFYDREQFEQIVQQFFDAPDTLIFGDETANQCFQRFSDAVDTLVAHHPGETLAISTHGTVMTLYLSRHVGFAPFPFWKAIQMPDAYGVTLPDFRLLP